MFLLNILSGNFCGDSFLLLFLFYCDACLLHSMAEDVLGCLDFLDIAKILIKL